MFFWFSSEKLLGFIMHRKGIDLNQVKAKAIQALKPIKTCKKLKSYKSTPELENSKAPQTIP